MVERKAVAALVAGRRRVHALDAVAAAAALPLDVEEKRNRKTATMVGKEL